MYENGKTANTCEAVPGKTVQGETLKELIGRSTEIADEILDVIRQHEYRLATKQGSIDYGMFTLGIQQAVDEQPTIDAVSVVRCRECKHYEMGVCLKIYDDGAASRYAWQERNDDDFCSYGELKEGAD